MVVKRWWDQFQRVPWPDNFLYWLSAYVRGKSGKARLIRRTIARYTVLAAILGWRSISVRVLKRFPTLHHVVQMGIMSEEERRSYERILVRHEPHKQWFVPLNWILSLLTKCYYEESLISHVNELRQLIAELEAYRTCFTHLFIYEWITIPLVYTQVAVVATYGYFGLCLIGRQYIQPSSLAHLPDSYTKTVDLYVPIFTILQFLFYVGWLKVGEDLMNPFGEDDEDFELNYLIDRHFEMAFIIVDDLHDQAPPLTDPAATAFSLPHTKASLKTMDKAPHGHLDKIPFTKSQMEILIPNFSPTNPGAKSPRIISRSRVKWPTLSIREKSDKYVYPYRQQGSLTDVVENARPFHENTESHTSNTEPEPNDMDITEENNNPSQK